MACFISQMIFVHDFGESNTNERLILVKQKKQVFHHHYIPHYIPLIVIANFVILYISPTFPLLREPRFHSMCSITDLCRNSPPPSAPAWWSDVSRPSQDVCLLGAGQPAWDRWGVFVFPLQTEGGP